MKNPVFEDAPNCLHTPSSEVNLTPGEILLGNLVGFTADGKPLVSHPLLTQSDAVVALSTQALSHQHIGRQVALMGVDKTTDQLIIVGVIHSPLYSLLDSMSVATDDGHNEPIADETLFEQPIAHTTQGNAEEVLKVDGKRIFIEGQEEITLSCGEASITLTKAGKILLRGTYLQSRSSGVNRILGGSVQVN
jgi:hypothetical protein